MTLVPPMTTANLRGALRTFGWAGVDLVADLEDFQRGYALGPALVVDGKNGPRTREAVRTSLRNHNAGRPDASPSFSFREFACRCGGTLPGCRRIRVQRQLLLDLEQLRQLYGGPLAIASGYRCPGHNAKVGGATSSQHLWGAAADVAYRLSWQQVARMRLFSGIGRSKRTGKVRHVDVRHVSGHNTTAATPERPTVWDYAA